jgi:Ca-activated chloride channel family protein
MIVANPIYLQVGAGFVILVALGLWSYGRRRRRLIKFLGGFGVGARLSASRLHRAPWIRILLVGCATAAIALAGAEPLRRVVETEVVEPPPLRETVVALDVSASMQATDAVPSRLGLGVALTEALLDRLSGDRVGLLLFAGQGYRLASPTGDFAALRYLLSGVVPTIASAHDPGTLLSIAVREAGALFDSDFEGATERTILVIADGEAGEPEGLAVGAARDVAQGGVRVHTIGVGTAMGARVVMPTAPYQLGGLVVDEDRRPVISRLREETMSGLAAAGGGLYAQADDPEALEALFHVRAVDSSRPGWACVRRNRGRAARSDRVRAVPSARRGCGAAGHSPTRSAPTSRSCVSG